MIVLARAFKTPLGVRLQFAHVLVTESAIPGIHVAASGGLVAFEVSLVREPSKMKIVTPREALCTGSVED